MDMSLGSLLGARPTSRSGPRFDAVGRWLLELAGDGVAEACVFTNVTSGSTEVVRPGWRRCATSASRVRQAERSPRTATSTPNMLEHIELRRGEGDLAQVVVASGDGRAFRTPLESLVRDGIDVTVIGFREYASFAQASDMLGSAI